jgi:hypothetical protein
MKKHPLEGTIAEGVKLPPGYHVMWAPHRGRQAEFAASQEFEVLYGGAKGGGKSDALVALALEQVHLAAYHGLVLRARYGELDELILRSHKLYPQHPMKPRWSAEKQRWMFPNPDNSTGAGGAFVQFGYCERKEHVEQYQGREWGAIFYDELGNQPDENVWIDLLKEIRSPDPRVVRKARASANPGFAGHAWIKRRFIIPCGKHGERIHRFVLKMEGIEEFVLERRFVPALITDNPVYAKDPAYLANLSTLPEVRRKQLLEGDWDIGLGLALQELSEDVHFCRKFHVPSHWFSFGGFDWGFQHRWVAVELAANEDGRLFVVDTVKGWRDLPDQIGDKMSRNLEMGRISYMSAGHDVWAKHRARGGSVPTVAERLFEYGVPLVRANQDPVHGLNNLRDYVSYVGRGPDGTDWEPGLIFMDTPGNRWLFEQLTQMVVDEDDREVVLKVDSNPDTGEGGDDGYDALRFAVASRPPRGKGGIAGDLNLSAFSSQVLRAEMEATMRVRNTIPRDEERELLEGEGIFL